MFYRFTLFFRKSYDKLKKNPNIIEHAVCGIGVAASIYHYPESSKQWTQSHMTLFYNQLSDKDKLAITQDPQKKEEFLADCRGRLRLTIGPPD